MSSILNRDFIIEVNKGNIAGHRMVGVVSSNEAVGTTFADIWSGGGDLVYQTGGETLELVFADANDTAAGTGAQEVTIVSMDATGVEQTTVTVSNGGTAAVSGTHYDIQSINVTAVGTVRGGNIGDITLQVSGGGEVRGKILVGKMSSQSSHYTVPLGFTALWIEGFANSVKGEDTQVRPLFQFGGTGVFNQGGTSSTYQGHLLYPFKTFLVMPEKSRILQQAKSTNTNVNITSVNEFMLIENALVSMSLSALNMWAT